MDDKKPPATPNGESTEQGLDVGAVKTENKEPVSAEPVNTEPVNTEPSGNQVGVENGGEGTATLVVGGSVTESPISIINQVSNYYRENRKLKGDRDEKVYKIKATELKISEKERAVFVPPEGYEKKLLKPIQSKNNTRHIVVLYGEEGSGRFICGENLALNLQSKVEKNIYLDSDNILSLLLSSGKEIKNGTVYLYPNKNNINIEEYSRNLSQFNKILEEKNGYLIIINVNEVSGGDSLIPFKCQQPNIASLFKKHFEYYSHIKSLQKDISSLLEKGIVENKNENPYHLTTGYEVDQFFLKLTALDITSEFSATQDKTKNFDELDEKEKEQALKKILEGLAKRLRQIGRQGYDAPRVWFSKLNESQKLFAMLAVLLHGLDRDDLEKFYIPIVKSLRQDGLGGFQDIRTFGMDDLLESLHAVVENGVITFLTDHEKEIQRQIDNRHYLLWSIFENIINSDVKEIARTNWVFREAIGQALGRVGLRYSIKLEETLEGLARNESGRIVVIAGYALAQISSHDDGHQFVNTLLQKWTSSKDPDLCWAAASSVWRIHWLRSRDEGWVDELWKYLEDIVKDIDKVDSKSFHKIRLLDANGQQASAVLMLGEWLWQKVSVVSDAIDHMFDKQPDNIALRLINWLMPDKSLNFSLVGAYTMSEILERICNPDFITFESVKALLNLYPNLLAYCQRFPENEDLFDGVFKALYSWLAYDNFTEDQKQEIVSILKKNLDQLDSDQLSLFRKGAFENRPMDVNIDSSLNHTLGELLSQTYFLDGFPIADSSLGSVLLLIDQSKVAKEAGVSYVISRLHPLINAFVDTYVGAMGFFQILGKPNKPFNELNDENNNQVWFPWHPLPRLLSNICSTYLQETKSSSFWPVQINYGPVLDLDDFHARFGNVNLLSLDFFKDIEDNSKQTWITRHKYEAEILLINDWSRIIDDLLEFTTQKLCGMGVGDLWTSVSSLLNCEPIVSKVMTSIRKMFIEKGDRFTREDYVAISGAILWALKNDSAYVIDTCNNWLLERENNSNINLAGVVCGKLSLRASLFSETVAPNIAELMTSLLKTKPDWSTFEIVLKYIIKISDNVEDNSLVDKILPKNIASAVPEHLHDQVRGFIQSWLDSKETHSNRAQKYIGRLKLLIDIGFFAEQPQLSNGKKFGLFFIDGDLREPFFLDTISTFLPVIEKTNIGSTIFPVVYRLGQTMPLSVGYGDGKVDAKSDLPKLPNLLGPILSSFPTEKVLFRVILVMKDIIDFDDQKQLWGDVTTIIFYFGRMKGSIATSKKQLYLSLEDFNTVSENRGGENKLLHKFVRGDKSWETLNEAVISAIGRELDRMLYTKES